jgi:hypothetical protein
MAVFKGTRSIRYINFKDRDTDLPIDITGWEFRAALRRSPSADVELGELTTANNGFVIVDAPNGRLALIIDDTLSATLPVGRVHFDVLYENAAEGPIWVFGGNFLVREPVTR